MAFERDIFISYAHIDNLALKEGAHGWVENFHRALEVRLAQLMGEKPRIWRDPKLKGNDIFSDEIVAQLPKTALMLSILSPRYIKSEWCTRELQKFAEEVVKKGGMRIGNRSRIFKLIKTAIPYDAHPEEIADTLGYEFYVTDPVTGKVQELSQRCSGDLEQTYWARLDDVAHDMCDTLAMIKGGTPDDSRAQNDRLTIYLAETSYELKEQREMIKRELIEHGYHIVPDCRLPYVESEFKNSVTHFLDQSALAIHLVGRDYGAVPEGSKKSISVLQNELAVKKSMARGLQRLIWLQPGSEGEDERQNRFINQVRMDPNSQYGADMFETPLKEFKQAIHDKLAAIKAAAKKKKPSIFLAETNYYLNEQRESIKQRLLGQGYPVLPQKPLPLVYRELTRTLESILPRCNIAIHLLGKDYGLIPDKTDQSIIAIQDELAAKRSRQGQLQRLVWISPEINRDDERQRSFIDSVKTKADKQPHDDIFEVGQKEIEAAVFEKLAVIEEKKRRASKSGKVPVFTAPGKVAPLIYLICDRRDLDKIVALEDFLYKSECDVIIPAFEGEEAELIRDHRENLKLCDGVLVYYGAGNDLWLRSVTRELAKIAGYGRSQPLSVKAVFLAPPAAKPKQLFRAHDYLIMDGQQGFLPELLEPFIVIVKASGED